MNIRMLIQLCTFQFIPSRFAIYINYCFIIIISLFIRHRCKSMLPDIFYIRVHRTKVYMYVCMVSMHYVACACSPVTTAIEAMQF